MHSNYLVLSTIFLMLLAFSLISWKTLNLLSQMSNVLRSQSESFQTALTNLIDTTTKEREHLLNRIQAKDLQTLLTLETISNDEGFPTSAWNNEEQEVLGDVLVDLDEMFAE